MHMKSNWIWGVVCLAALAFSNFLCASDWPVARGNAASTGASSDQLPSEPELIWSLELGGTGFEGAPVVFNKTVFLGDVDGRFVAIDLLTGKIRWEKRFDTSFLAPAACIADRVFIGDADGNLRALKASDGSEIWSFTTQSQIDASANFFGQNLLITSEDGTLYCLNQKDGQLVWKYETGDQLRCAASLAGNLTFLGGCDGKLHIVDVELGKSAREPAPLEAPTGSTPAVDGDVAIVPTHAGDLFAINATTGKSIWKMRDPKLAQEFQNSVAVSQGLVIASSHNRRVFALDIKDGSKLWDVALRKRADNSPVIASDKVVIAASDGRIVMLDLKTGRELWLHEVKGSFIASPAIADNRIIVATDKGTIYCFGNK